MTEASPYLLVLYLAERRGATPTSPGHVADSLDRSPSATTEMLQRLDSRGLVAYEPYEGATLTADGRETAAELYDRYRVLSRFLDDVLGLESHRENAMRLAAKVSPTTVDRLAATLPDEEGGPDSSASSRPDEPRRDD